MHNKKLFIILAALFMGIGHAAAAPVDAMPIAGEAKQPIGHHELCMSQPVECSSMTSKPVLVRMTPALMRQTVRINETVNRDIIAMTDWQIWGIEERWSYPVDGIGDCEDFVLEKRRQLMALGVPASSLLITVVLQPNGEGHAVLTFVTDRGEFILDNLNDMVLDWHETDYHYIKRQSQYDTARWHQIDDPRVTAVGSIR